MRSASARAAFRIDSACSRCPCADCGRARRGGRATAGSGGSCWKANPSSVAGMPGPGVATGLPLDELVIFVVLRAPDRERARLLELPDGGDDAALRLLDDAAALRRLELHLLREHLGAALLHVAHDLLLHVVGRAAKREREVL